MKILMVAIPNHHFFQWVNQLKDAGHEVFWFDITAGAGFSDKIGWVRQYSGWKLKWDFPFRSGIKNSFPQFYRLIQKINDRNPEIVFQNYLNQIAPDIVHSFELKLSCLPILNVMQKNKIPWIYSSWGSDVFYHKELGVSTNEVLKCLQRIDFLVTDCQRDYRLLQEIGYKNKFLGVFPGNGGIDITTTILAQNNRNNIIVKGYDDGVGQAIVVVKALLKIENLQQQIVVYSADDAVVNFIDNLKNEYQSLKIRVFARNQFIENKKLLQMMGESIIYIGNSSSDGMPNSLLEAMGMGAFPIQSNPGGVTEEVIDHGKNGYLISDCFDVDAISKLIREAINNENLRQTAQQYNTRFIVENYDRKQLKNSIVALYKSLKIS